MQAFQLADYQNEELQHVAFVLLCFPYRTLNAFTNVLHFASNVRNRLALAMVCSFRRLHRLHERREQPNYGFKHIHTDSNIEPVSMTADADAA